ncbi:family 43 glycosylhydrolase [Chitinophaga sp. SYP-B3965]|uniref:family 43 glycosylhydrolase n=1 Tax=Chitinophaga sp. SYP-B3965 TaxID=2663120 RepID=UPI00129960C5|nr:family 43 glycosylhydrolase [Chitinophaga sp. SYP-B3965]MRG44092.1 family 43 glycosylhydrolase [Chitinophaga sp. SYP-B3965]
MKTILPGLLCLALLSACQKKISPDLQRPSLLSVVSPEDVIVESTFTNPLKSSGADPWVSQKNGKYYFTYTQGSKLVLYETTAMSELASAKYDEAWIPPTGMPYSKNLWAPELHEINGKWYIYFAADNGTNANHRMYVVENSSADPMQGTWVMKGKVADSTDQWAIDGTVIEYGGQLYMLWSGGNAGAAPQRIYIAEMSDPWTISGPKVAISSPTYSWEKNGSAINEGPQPIINPNGQLQVVYSGSGYWVDTYCLGLLSLAVNGDPMDPADWVKTSTPVFSMNANSGAYGPGHNGFFKSPDGTEDWLIYHARSTVGGGARNARIQKFTWNVDGSPNFGIPVQINTPVDKPSGEPIRNIYKKDNWSIAGFSSEETNNSRLAIRIIDNNAATPWICRYSSSPTSYPNHWIAVDMQDTLAVDGFVFVQKDGDRKIKEMEVLVGNDNATWESLGTIELVNLYPNKQYFTLPVRKEVRYFKLVPVSGHDSQPQPGMAEVGTFVLD